MDINTLKRRLQEESEKAINYQSKAEGFGNELTQAINQNDAAYKPFENDVNQSRNAYYNTTGNLLPEITKKSQYSNDPMLALQALENERTIGGTKYQNSQDSLQRRKGSLADLVNSFSNQANSEANRQNSLVGLLQGQYQTSLAEDAARKQANSLSSLFTGTGGGSDAGQTTKYDPNNDPTFKTPGKSIGERRVAGDGQPYTFNGQDWVPEDVFIQQQQQINNTRGGSSYDPFSGSSISKLISDMGTGLKGNFNLAKSLIGWK